jgi:hypothetical protein
VVPSLAAVMFWLNSTALNSFKFDLTLRMNVSLTFLALAALVVFSSCQKEKAQVETQSKRIYFEPEVGESWRYEVTVRLDPAVNLPAGVVEIGPEGSRTEFAKERRYLGKQIPAEGYGKAHAFAIFKEGKQVETEFSLFTEEGIMARGTKKTDEAAFILDPPVLVVPEKLELSASWPLELPNPNDPTGPPMVSRQFQYLGTETIQILGGRQEAYHVKVFGKTGPVQMQRDYWFVNQIGFVKERRAYYLGGQRVALLEEELVEHNQPGSELSN